MPVGKRSQTDPMLWVVVVFVALFIIATSCAIVFYIKFEDQRAIAESTKRQLDEIATPSEVGKLGTLVGAERRPNSRIATLVNYLDEAIALIASGPAADTSAEMKVSQITSQVRDELAAMAKQHPEVTATDPNDPNDVSLLRTVDKLVVALQDSKNMNLKAAERIDQLQKRLDDTMAEARENERRLLAEKETFQQQVNKFKADYDELRALVEKTADESVKDLLAKLDQERSVKDDTNRELLKTQAELQAAQGRIQKILEESVYPLKPPPDVEGPAFKPDGKVILVDNQAKIVHLNIGQDERVYRGLTFSVYEKNQPIPRDGKGKAEIEVFNVDKNVAAARIVRSESRNPIVVDDIAANLIWDSGKANTFVVAGDFDLNGNRTPDSDAAEKIEALIKKWGGSIANSVTVNTDFVILGEPPAIPRRPTVEDLEIYPDATERYERAMARLDAYRQVLAQAQSLSIPVLNTERFLYFIGYTTQATQPGGF